MKPSLENFGRPQMEPLQFKEHVFTDNNDSEKPCSSVKRKLAFLITLFIALGAFLMTACDDEPEFCKNCSYRTTDPTPIIPTPISDSTTIRAIHPTDGAPGDVVSIVLENFDGSGTEYGVTFGSSLAEVIHARWGMIRVRVPLDLQEGSYTVSLRFHGRMISAPTAFNVTQSKN